MKKKILLILLSVLVTLTVSCKSSEEKHKEIYDEGASFLEFKDYEEAIEKFEEYLEYTTDESAYIEISKAHFALGEYKEALHYIEKAESYDRNNNTVEEYLLLADYHTLLGHIDAALMAYKNADEVSGIEVSLERVRSLYSDFLNHESIINYAEVLGRLTTTDETLAVIENWCIYNDEINLGYNMKGNFLYHVKEFYKSIEPYEKSMAFDPSIITYENLFYAYYEADLLFLAKDYYYENHSHFSDEPWLRLYLGDIHFKLTEYEESIEIYEALLETEDNTSPIYYSLANNYYRLGDDLKALEYLDMYRNQSNKTDNYVLELKKLITNRTSSTDDVSYIKQLFDENYMYEANYDVLDALSGNLNNEEAMALIMAMKAEDDPFTFLRYGEQYKAYYSSDSALTYKKLDNDVHYLKMDAFTQIINYEFLHAIHTIEKPEDSTLVIDLRDNGGGTGDSTISILDYLIGEAILLTTKNDTEEDVIYESDSAKIAFKEIYVLLNNNSASSSEVLALGLDENLENVVLLGEQTAGKGVGQLSFQDTINERIYYIVNFYWYINDINVHEIGITPEVYVKNEDIDTYMMDLFDLTEF